MQWNVIVEVTSDGGDYGVQTNIEMINNFIQKGKRSKQTLHQKDTWMATKHMKRRLMSLSMRCKITK